MRRVLSLAILLAIGVAALTLYCFTQARRDPLVRTATIRLPRWPPGAKPVRAILISDIHIGSSAMGRARLGRIVGLIDAARPDIVLIAGDMIFGHDPHAAARWGNDLSAGLAALHPPLGVVAVPGNHDHDTGIGDVRRALERSGVTVLANQAIRRGPLAIGGVDDDFSRHADVAGMVAAMRTTGGAPVILTHSPDVAPDLPADMPLVLAGHTHCGQVVPPFWGPIAEVSRYGARYRCGIRREGRRAVVTTAGLGTSGVPFRLGAPPDLWLLTLGP